MAKGSASKVVIALLSVATAGCAGSGGQSPSFTLPSLPSVGALQLSSESAPDGAPAAPTSSGSATAANALDEHKAPVTTPISGSVGSATAIYSRVASGAMSCWFAVGGPFKSEYIYHASADAPSRGGKAAIAIHRRDPTQPNPRGAKVYLIDITPSGDDSANVTTENRKMPDAFASAMTEDVRHWAQDEPSCTTPSVVAAARPPAAPASEKATADAAKHPKTKAAKKKPKVKAAEATANAPHSN
ncbi:hypothetical protein DLM45_12380 [Hyphomicrobium methylovorum]|uniref:hypothetical protein n=1 Tax=Hyphomicrobium methylovorum TaxID=84 RepID=UPI0015E67EB1|nr:hypothetical protein [Hyphomicrobium methylovorum]MBA2127011.1 hypothetical protein [Hyphomicrobium methylovorum]